MEVVATVPVTVIRGVLEVAAEGGSGVRRRRNSSSWNEGFVVAIGTRSTRFVYFAHRVIVL